MYRYFRPRIRSRHPSHAPLRERGAFPLFPFKSVIRFGSSKEYADTVANGGTRVELNTVVAIKNSSSKLKMKTRFTENEVKTADWWLATGEDIFVNSTTGEDTQLQDLPFPIISKSFYGSRNKGNKKHDDIESLRAWMVGKNLDNYLFEKYYNFTREYRLHVSKNGCFYTCRKMLKADTPDDAKWYRNDEHCVWILEENESFDKPVNWDNIVDESVKALQAVGLDFGAIDLRIQGANDAHGVKREEPEFIIVEINSAPSFGEVTVGKYKDELSILLTQKKDV